MSLRWEEGRIVLPDGRSLAVAARGPGAAVRWTGEALEVSAAVAEGAATPGDGTIELLVSHPIDEAQDVWVPHLTPATGNVAGDAVFRSPAVIVSDAKLALALVPDVDDVAGARGWKAWLDYEAPVRTMTLAMGAYEAAGHVFYERRPARRPHPGASLRLHVIASAEPSDCANPYGMAARWMWDRWGRAGHGRRAMPPLSVCMDHVVRWALSRDGWTDVWQDVDLDLPEGRRAGAPVFIVDVTRHPSVPPERRTWREPPSIWNQAWFSTQRCANGLLRHGRTIGSEDVVDRARRMTEIALAAPERDGLFPAVLVREEARAGRPVWRWSNSTRRPASVSEEACHVVDAAFTCRMLLEWHRLTGEPRALAKVRRFAERLRRLQLASGAFPGWVEPDGRVAPELAEGPESAVSASLLLDLGDERALSGLAFLERVVRDGRWEDFETYYSCAPWGAADQIGRRVARNGVFKQNTLSIFWCAEAFFGAWRATGKRSHLALARRCVDELSLYQAVWDPPFLPAPAHGGFGVMNADCEWNDARQSLFAPLYLDMGRETGDAELIERGVSAIRASFTMLYCPENAPLARAYERRFPFFGPESYGFMMENQGHDPNEPIGTFTIFTWGNGSALATVAAVRDRFPGLAREHGIA